MKKLRVTVLSAVLVIALIVQPAFALAPHSMFPMLKNLDVAAGILKGGRIPEVHLEKEMEGQFQGMFVRPDLRLRFYPGYRGFVVFLPGPAGSPGEIINYALPGHEGKLPEIFLRWFTRKTASPNMPVTPGYSGHGPFKVATRAMDAKQWAVIQSILETETPVRVREQFDDAGLLRPAPGQWTVRDVGNWILRGNWQGQDILLTPKQRDAQWTALEKDAKGLAGNTAERAQLVRVLLALAAQQGLSAQEEAVRAERIARVSRALALPELSGYLRAVAGQSRSREVALLCFEAWADLQTSLDSDSAAYAARVATQPGFVLARRAALELLFKYHSALALEVVSELWKDAGQGDIAGLYDEDLADLLSLLPANYPVPGFLSRFRPSMVSPDSIPIGASL